MVIAPKSGSFDCLDLPSRVSNLAGIIICDTHRPGEFPYDPNAPKEGWAGLAHRLDDDTARIVLNSYVPEGYYLTAEDRDNGIALREIAEQCGHTVERAGGLGLVDDR